MGEYLGSKPQSPVSNAAEIEEEEDKSCLASGSPRPTLARAALIFSLTILTFPAFQSTEWLRIPLSLHAPSTG